MTPDNLKYGPECINCGDKYEIDKFDSSAWMQIDTTRKSHSKDTIYKPGIIDLIWICPECINKYRGEKYKVQLGVPDTEFVFNTLEEAQKFANEEGSASGIKTTIIKFEVVEEASEYDFDIIRHGISMAISDWEGTAQSQETLLDSIMKIIKINIAED